MKALLRRLAGVRREVWLGLYGACIAAILPAYFQSLPIPGFLSKATGLFSGVLLVAALAAFGGRVLRGLERLLGSIHESSTVARFFACLGLGSAGCGALVLALGTILPGDLSLKLRLLLAALVINLVFALPRGALRTLSASKIFPMSMGEIVCVVLSVAGMAAAFAACFGPITYYDSLVYHLALPSHYLKEGAIGPVAFNLYSTFPAAMEMNFMLALAALPEPETAINLLGWAMSAGTGAMIATWAAERLNRRTGFIAHALWWTSPAVILLSFGAYVDVPLAFFLVLSLRAFDRARAANGSAWTTLSGLFAGASFACKYTGGLTVGLLFCAAALLVLQRKQTARSFLLFGVAALIPGIPWLIKNAVTVGNPVFPFLYKHWGSAHVGWTGATAAGYFQMLTEYGATSHVLYDLLVAPWTIATKPLAFGGGFDVLGDFGWPLFLFGAPVVLLWRDRRRSVAPLALYLAAHFVLWFVSKPVLRFLIPALPIFAILAAGGIDALLSDRGARRIVALGISGLWLLSNAFQFIFIADGFQLYRVPAGLVSREEFLARRMPYYRLFSTINREAPDQRVFLLGEQRTFHLNGPVIASNLFAPSPLAIAANAVGARNAIRNYLEDERIGLMVMATEEIKRLGGLFAFGFSAEGEKALFDYLSEETDEITGFNTYRIFKTR